MNAEKANFMEALLILRSAHNSVAVIMLTGRCAVTHLQIVSMFYQSTGVLVRQFSMAVLLHARFCCSYLNTGPVDYIKQQYFE